MSDVVYSHAGVKLAVSQEVANADLDEAGFDALTWIEVGNVGAIGEYGLNTNMITYDTMDTLVSRKAKGITNAGDPQIEVARADADTGQIQMGTIGQPDYFDAHAFRVTKQDDSIDYLRGLCAGPNSPGGRNEDFDLHTFNLGLNQAPLHKLAP